MVDFTRRPDGDSASNVVRLCASDATSPVSFDQSMLPDSSTGVILPDNSSMWGCAQGERLPIVKGPDPLTPQLSDDQILARFAAEGLLGEESDVDDALGLHGLPGWKSASSPVRLVVIPPISGGLGMLAHPGVPDFLSEIHPRSSS